MVDDRPVFLTEKGMSELSQELEHLRRVRRSEVAARIGQAKEYGDISENSEYEDAKNEQAFVEGRIREVEAILNRARLLKEDSQNGGVIRLGAHVTTTDDDGEREAWTLVSSAEASATQGKISDESPLGRALLGRRVGDQVTVQAPRGTLRFKIVQID